MIFLLCLLAGFTENTKASLRKRRTLTTCSLRAGNGKPRRVQRHGHSTVESDMTESQSTHVEFKVEFEDGSRARMSIDKWHLNDGDFSARAMARERQAEGKLPPGQIRLVKRL